MATVAAPVTPLRDRPASSRRSAATAASSSTHPATPFSLDKTSENDSPASMFATPTLATPPPWSPATSTKTPTAPPARSALFGANSSFTPDLDDDDDHISIHDVDSPTLMLAGPGAPWRTATTAWDQRARSRRTTAAPSARPRRGQSTPPPADRSSTASSKASTPTQARPPRFRLPVHHAPVRPASFHATTSIHPDAAVARLPAARKTRAGGMHPPPLKRAQTQPVPTAAPSFSTPIVVAANPDPVIRPRIRLADPAVALPLLTAPPLSTRETDFVDNLIRARGRPRARKSTAEVVEDVAVHFADSMVVTPPRVRTAPPVLPRRALHDAPPVTEAAIRGAQDAARLATTARVGSIVDDTDLVANAVGIDVTQPLSAACNEIYKENIYLRCAPRPPPAGPIRQVARPCVAQHVSNFANDFYTSVLDFSPRHWLAYASYRSLTLLHLNGAHDPYSDLKPIYKLPFAASFAHPMGARDARATAVRWAPDARHVAVGTSTGHVVVVDVTTMQPVRVVDQDPERCRAPDPQGNVGEMCRVNNVAWTADAVLATGALHGRVAVHDLRDRAPRAVIARDAAHDGIVCGLQPAPPGGVGDGPLIVTGGNDNAAKIWDARAGMREARTTHWHTSAVKALAWCPANSALLLTGAGTADRNVRVFDTRAATDAPLAKFQTDAQIVHAAWTCATTNRAEILTVHGHDPRISFWDVNGREVPGMIRCPRLHDSEDDIVRVFDAVTSRDGGVCAVATTDERLLVWDVSVPPPPVGAEEADDAPVRVWSAQRGLGAQVPNEARPPVYSALAAALATSRRSAMHPAVTER
ncbi:hypothetical protein AMAG_08285 [Allomyces macrogynus ATCC 38327]|uniref:Uncharacterized protein n=1 Tax=Allomyces macrogynus (strain ATCC 38327) TaxID=578462 RepID=A0A0L0SKR6_ALLM3|nr:hypothetical protein AMAG_08285 [Allomyces macrogynus ATCC 38327]|eukprot:KNE63122.1 hypothetical protein AMAG_08285 [Allomyces macrogynus ATCC 38327]